MPVSRTFYFFVCAAATLIALYVLTMGHFPWFAWTGLGLAVLVLWVYGFIVKGWKTG